MKIALYSRSINADLDDLITCFSDYGVECVVNPTADLNLPAVGLADTGDSVSTHSEECDLAVSFGGDGTFLNAVRKMGRRTIPILGINSGRLGFLATVDHEHARQAAGDLVAGNYTLQDRLMIEVSGPNVPPDARALNEFAIQKSGTAMVEISIEIDGHQVASYWADGVIVSTPTGSTAYSMSVGGAILTPGCQSLIISPIAPHNLNIRSLVVPSDSRICISVRTRSVSGNSLSDSCDVDGNDTVIHNSAIATIDNCEFEAPSSSQYFILPSKDPLQEIVLSGISFYDTLRSKLLWGRDLRR